MARAAVSFHNDASEGATVIEVHAPDQVGALYRITRAMADLDLDIRLAKIETLGHQIIDSFYVVDADGAKVVDAGRLHEIERAVLHGITDGG
jgi:[protein-PII] uridylyltransferase